MADNSDDRIRLTLSRSTGFTLDVDLRLPSGGVTVLFGVSGCGKTTVLRSAAGLEKAQGYVRIAGQVWQDDEKHLLFRPTNAASGTFFRKPVCSIISMCGRICASA